jgi:hypothetical protein
MPENPENTGQMMMLLGELRGQVRELVHSVNNLRQDVGTVFEKMATTQGLPAAVLENKADIAALEVRVTALETSEHRRAGAIGLSAWIFKTVPFAALGGGMVAAWKVLGL